MKKILIALLVAGFASFSAEGQMKGVACGKPEGKVCTKKGCYKTKYAENFKVCKSDYGYYICCQAPNATNSTFPPLPVADVIPYRQQEVYAEQTREWTGNRISEETDQSMVPQSQSYARYSSNVPIPYDGGYVTKKRIKVCNNTNNVAEANRAAYQGCPTPAYDGVENNKRRNLNVSTPNSSAPLAPITGGNSF